MTTSNSNTSRPEIGYYALKEDGKVYSVFQITKVNKKSYNTYIIYHSQSELNHKTNEDISFEFWTGKAEKLTQEEMMEYL